MSSPWLFGASYYPEHWAARRWPVDAALMRRLGFNAVRLAEFAWSRLEPEPGRFELHWLRDAIHLLHEQGISTILCTPTAAPPRWLFHEHGDALACDADGRPTSPEARKHRSIHHPAVRRHCRAIVQRLGEAFAGEPAVIGWQIDNELGGARDYGPAAAHAFRDWLRQRYPSLEALNDAWGNVFWSQELTDWQQVTLPRPALWGKGPANPSMLLDFCRFHAQAFNAFVDEQVQLLRAAGVAAPITTNWMPMFEQGIDHATMAGMLDLTAWDNYATEPGGAAFNHDINRGLSRTGSFWTLEQRCAPPDGPRVSPLVPTGFTSAMTAQAIGRGCAGTFFFRWRQCPFGAERDHGGILRHDGQPATRIFNELQHRGDRLRRLAGDLAQARVDAPVALLIDHASWWAISPAVPHWLKRRPAHVDYLRQLRRWHEAVTRLGVNVDVIAADAPLEAYRVVIAPMLSIASEAMCRSFESLMQRDGTIIAGPMLDVVDTCAQLRPHPAPAQLRELFGVQVREFDCLAEAERCPIELHGQAHQAELVCELLEPDDADVLARYADRFYAGTAAITSRRRGAAEAVYVGTFADTSVYQALLRPHLAARGVACLDNLPEAVSASRLRRSNGRACVLLVNHSDTAQQITLDSHTIAIEPYDWHLLDV